MLSSAVRAVLPPRHHLLPALRLYNGVGGFVRDGINTEQHIGLLLRCLRFRHERLCHFAEVIKHLRDTDAFQRGLYRDRCRYCCTYVFTPALICG